MKKDEFIENERKERNKVEFQKLEYEILKFLDEHELGSADTESRRIWKMRYDAELSFHEQGFDCMAISGMKRLLFDMKLSKLPKDKDVKMRIMFDNDILNKLVDSRIDLDKIIQSNKFEFYTTHVQSDQASRCGDADKRARLELAINSIRPIVIPTESYVLDRSRMGYARLSDGKELEKLKKGNDKHTEDALIAETAIKNCIILVTNDKTLRSRVNASGGHAINLEEFEKIANISFL